MASLAGVGVFVTLMAVDVGVAVTTLGGVGVVVPVVSGIGGGHCHLCGGGKDIGRRRGGRDDDEGSGGAASAVASRFQSRFPVTAEWSSVGGVGVRTGVGVSTAENSNWGASSGGMTQVPCC